MAVACARGPARISSVWSPIVSMCHHCHDEHELVRNRLDHDGRGQPHAGRRSSADLVQAATARCPLGVLRARSFGRGIQCIRIDGDAGAVSFGLRGGSALGTRPTDRDRAIGHRVCVFLFWHWQALACLRRRGFSAAGTAAQFCDRSKRQLRGRDRVAACDVVGRRDRDGSRRHAQSMAIRGSDRQSTTRGFRRRRYDRIVAPRRSYRPSTCRSRGRRHRIVPGCRYNFRTLDPRWRGPGTDDPDSRLSHCRHGNGLRTVLGRDCCGATVRRVARKRAPRRLGRAGG